MRHVIRRLLFYLSAVWVAVTLDFFIPRLAPGDPVAALVGKMSQVVVYVPVYVYPAARWSTNSRARRTRSGSRKS